MTIRCLWYGLGGKSGINSYFRNLTSQCHQDLEFKLVPSYRIPFNYSFLRYYRNKWLESHNPLGNILTNIFICPDVVFFTRRYEGDIIHGNNVIVVNGKIPWVFSYDHLVSIPPVFSKWNYERRLVEKEFKRLQKFPHFRLQYKLLKNVINSTGKLLPWSRHAAKLTRLFYDVDDEKIEVFYPSIRYHPDSEVIKKDHDIPIIIFIGGDFIRKGGKYLLNVLDKIEGDFKFIAFTRNIPARYQEIFEKKENFDLKIGLSFQEIEKYYFPMADFLVLPSLSEGLSFVLFEAMNYGIPIVASEVNGIPEVVIHKKNGLIIHFDNYLLELKEHIQRMIDDRNLREGLGKNGRKLIKEKFNSELAINKLYDIYQEIIEMQG
ncbi:MAG: glycosyltransferase family 4 protein [Promethearchaeota archaeon]